ncbi:hypothetical protein [Streptomyces sp. 5-10]|uniref:hypothetical protein n=1 Tax=Streptomyces sp. 5-10 TaxID=878925 RepID=UPI00168BA441|nr:hypothetical protein [Streptomyces sp. 5-10]MBD3004758.1 hypothetical protein [Streptomyces sp. 5-10]
MTTAATDDTYIKLPYSAITDLEPRTLGLFATFLTLGEGASMADLASARNVSDWIVRRAVSELEAKGYLIRGYKHEGGRLRGTTWTVNLHPSREQDAA